MPNILGTIVVDWLRDNRGCWLEEDGVHMCEIIAPDVVTPGINNITMGFFAGPWQTQKKSAWPSGTGSSRGN